MAANFSIITLVSPSLNRRASSPGFDNHPLAGIAPRDFHDVLPKRRGDTSRLSQARRHPFLGFKFIC
jgi:hypothetical protein